MSSGQPEIVEVPATDLDKQIADTIGQLKRLQREMREQQPFRRQIEVVCGNMRKLQTELGRAKDEGYATTTGL
jgi:hypothetical protein